MDADGCQSDAPRSITARAVTIGLVGGAGLAAIGFVNDSVLGMTQIVGNHLPVSVYGLLVLGLLTVNPLLRRLSPRRALQPGEWAVALCITLAGAAVATNGMMRTLGPALVYPAKHYSIGPRSVWYQRHRVLEYLPPGVLVDDGRIGEDDRVVMGYVRGLQLDRPVTLGDVPWGAWARPLATWVPILVLMLLAGLCLAVIVVPQWADREHLAFPIAGFTRSLLDGHLPTEIPGVGQVRPVFRTPGFWVLLAVALGIHLVNGFHAYRPGFIHVPLSQWVYGPIVQKYPILGKVPGSWVQLHFPLYLAVVGFSFLVSREVSFTVGITGYLHMFVMAAMLKAGMSPGAEMSLSGYDGFFRVGAYVGITAAILHAGRSYYGPLLKRALGLRAGREGAPLPVGPARVMLSAIVGAIVLLSLAGLAWPLATLAVLALMMMYLVLARINAETGLFFVVPMFGITEIVAGLFGMTAAGPAGLLMVTLFASVAMSDIRVTIAPLVLNALLVAKGHRAAPARVSRWMVLMLLVAIPIGGVVSIYACYATDAPEGDWGLTTLIPRAAYDVASVTAETLAKEEDGALERSVGLTTWGRLGAIRPSGAAMSWIAAGALIVLGLTFLRRRLPWWPLHPFVAALWGVFTLQWFCFSFLVGWFVRTAVGRFFGERAVQWAKPLILGLIAGELLGAVIWLVVGWIYYLRTGATPPPFAVYPGFDSCWGAYK